MSIYQPLIKQKLVPRQVSYIPSALLIGKAGAGKTTLANKLSKVTYETSLEESITPEEENIYTVVYDRSVFLLIDASQTDISKRWNTQAHSQAIDTIFVVIKYDTRFEEMISVYLELEVSVTNDADKIVVMISHWDQSKSPEEDFKEICDLFAEECPDLINIIFYSEEYVDAELAKLMYSCVSNMQETIEDSSNTSSEHYQEAENEVIENYSDYNSNASTIIDDSEDAKEELPVKNELKRSFDQCQSGVESLHMQRQENEKASDVTRDKPKKMKQESNTISFWRRWEDFCYIS